jgi:hypothetical protein
MHVLAEKQQQQQQDAKFQRGPLTFQLKEHYSPHFSEAWITNISLKMLGCSVGVNKRQVFRI